MRGFKSTGYDGVDRGEWFIMRVALGLLRAEHQEPMSSWWIKMEKVDKDAILTLNSAARVLPKGSWSGEGPQ